MRRTNLQFSLAAATACSISLVGDRSPMTVCKTMIDTLTLAGITRALLRVFAFYGVWSMCTAIAWAQERSPVFVPFTGEEQAAVPVERGPVKPPPAPAAPSDQGAKQATEPEPSPPPQPLATEIRRGIPARVVVTSDNGPVLVEQVTGHASGTATGFAGSVMSRVEA